MDSNNNKDVFLYKDTIKEIFREYCQNSQLEFSELEFSKFINYLSLDIYDWIKGNLNYYD